MLLDARVVSGRLDIYRPDPVRVRAAPPQRRSTAAAPTRRRSTAARHGPALAGALDSARDRISGCA